LKAGVVYITDNLIRLRDVADQDKLKVIELNTSSLKKEEISHALKNLLRENKFIPEYLTLIVPRIAASVRYFSFPTLNDSEIRSMLEYDLSNKLAYKEDELVFDHVVAEKSAEGYSRVMAAIVPKDEIIPKFSFLKHVGLIPDEAVLSTASLFNQLVSIRKNADKFLLIYFDDGFAEIIYLKEGRLEFSRAINFKPAEMENLVREIKSTITILETEGKPISQAVIGGKFSGLEDFITLFKQGINLPVEIDNSLDTIKGFNADSGPLKLSLLPEEFRIRKVKEQRKRSLVYLGILLLLNLSLFANIAFFKIKAKDEYLFTLKSEMKKIDSLASALQKKMTKARTLKAYVNSGRLKLGLLAEIYRFAPDGIFLSSLDIGGNKGQGVIVLVGQGPDSESVLKFASSLKTSAFINKTDVSYINKRKIIGQQTVDFEIRAGF